MIITISGANFSASNIGTLSTWTVSKSIGAGAEHSIPSYVDKNSAFNYTITLKDGYTFGTYSVSMGGQTITPTVTETSMTINIASVTGAIRIEVKTINSSTGEPEEPGTGGDGEGGTLITSGSLTGTYLHENTKFAQVNGVDVPQLTADSSKAYFVMRDIPVNPNTTYRINKARACWYLDVNKQPLTTKYVNLTSEATNFTFTTPANCKYLRIAFKYVDIKPNAVEMVQLYTYGEGVETYLKDTTAEFRDNWAVETGKTEPSSYSGYFIYHLIPVTANNKYKIVNARLSIWYDSNKQFIKQDNFNVNSTSATTTDWSHVAPSNAAYLTICVNKSDTTKDKMIMIEYPRL